MARGWTVQARMCWSSDFLIRQVQDFSEAILVWVTFVQQQPLCLPKQEHVIRGKRKEIVVKNEINNMQILIIYNKLWFNEQLKHDTLQQTIQIWAFWARNALYFLQQALVCYAWSLKLFIYIEFLSFFKLILHLSDRSMCQILSADNRDTRPNHCTQCPLMKFTIIISNKCLFWPIKIFFSKLQMLTLRLSLFHLCHKLSYLSSYGKHI